MLNWKTNKNCKKFPRISFGDFDLAHSRLMNFNYQLPLILLFEIPNFVFPEKNSVFQSTCENHMLCVDRSREDILLCAILLRC